MDYCDALIRMCVCACVHACVSMIVCVHVFMHTSPKTINIKNVRLGEQVHIFGSRDEN